MSRRWFSGDFHLGFSALLKIEGWPFKTIEDHDTTLIKSCEEYAEYGDVIIHTGDLASVGYDRHAGINSSGLDKKPSELLQNVKADFINIKGNHDMRNKVRSTCDSMRTTLGRRYPNVSISHYPTYDKRCAGHFLNYDIHICGHVHSAWRHCLDLDNGCLNINVGCMVWGFRIISEEELIAYVNGLFKHKPDDLFRCRLEDGKIRFYPSVKGVLN